MKIKFKEFLTQYNIVDELKNYYLHKLNIRIKPSHLLVITTKRCNSRCIMCNIWQNKSDEGLISVSKFKKILHNNLFTKLKTITFSGGEAILDKRLLDLIKISATNLPNLRYIGLASNGLATPLVIKTVNNILKITSQKNIKLIVQISLDSIDQTHDQIRGIPNAHQKVIDTLTQLQKIKKINNQLDIDLSCVILPDNINKLKKLYLFSQKNNFKITFSPAITSTEYYKNDNSNIGLNKDQRKIAINFLKEISKKNDNVNCFYYKKIVIPILEGKDRQRSCTMGYNALVIESDGIVPFCINAEQFSNSNIKNTDPNFIWYQEMKQLLKNKKLKNLCLKCPASCGLGEYSLSEVHQLYISWKRNQGSPNIFKKIKNNLHFFKNRKILLYLILHPWKIIKILYILITKGPSVLEKKYHNAQKRLTSGFHNNWTKRLFISIIYFFCILIFFIISSIIKLFSLLFAKKISTKNNNTNIDGVSFIIPTWNKKELVLKCIELLDNHLSQEKINIKKEIIVIENGSNDNTAEAISSLKTKIPLVLLKQKTNLGFAKAINLALKHAQYNYVYLINNDMEPQKNFFSSIINTAQDLIKNNKDFFGIASQIFFFDPNKKREESGKTYSLPNSGYISIAHYIQEESLKKPSITLYPGGGSSLINKYYFQKIGGYDYKSYTPLYCEDLDAGFIAWKLGLPSYFDPNSQVVHHHRSSSVNLNKDPNYFMYKNWLVFILKNFDSPKNIFYHLFLYPIRIIFKDSYTKYSIESLRNIKNIFLSKINLFKYKTVNSDQKLINFSDFENRIK